MIKYIFYYLKNIQYKKNHTIVQNIIINHLYYKNLYISLLIKKINNI